MVSVGQTLYFYIHRKVDARCAMFRHVLVARLILFLSASAINLMAAGSVSVLASSSLETCVASGNGGPQNLTCSNKVVALVSIDGGALASTTQLRFSVSCVGEDAQSCPCTCNYATQHNCDCRDLNTTAVVRMGRSVVKAAYPLTYFRTFNARPYETGMITTDCRDGDYESEPTCGYTYDVASGTKLEDSQGFCCRCSSSDILDQTFSDDNNRRSRGNLYCGIDGVFVGRPLAASAHCMAMSRYWYEGFTVGESSLEFNIDISVEYPDTDIETTHLELSPSVPLGVADRVTAQLLGDLSGYQALPVLSEKILMIGPHMVTDPFALFSSNQTEQWMLIDKDMISYDGRQCNKIGTWFSAFRFEAERCRKVSGSCLNNQLLDIAETDVDRIRQGSVPRYMLARWGVRQQQVLQRESVAMRLVIPVPTIQLSMLRLELNADDLSLVVNASPGELARVTMCTFERADCSGVFESLAQTGYLYVMIRNIGTLDSDYTVAVTNCTDNVRGTAAQQLSVRSQQLEEVMFQIQMETAAGSVSSCAVVLYDSQARITDWRMTSFVTNATELSPNDLEIRNSDDSGQLFRDPNECAVLCSGMFDFGCFVTAQCWGKLGTAVAIIIAPVSIAVFICFLCCIRRCCLRPRTDKSTRV